MTSEGMRLDMLLVESGKVSTRSRAQRLIKASKVQVNAQVVRKASTICSPDDDIRVNDDQYVSRGAYKLIGAFDAYKPEIAGKLAMDIGASTGGFTQVLLEHQAKEVIALDVGHGQLNPIIANNPRVIEMSGVNIREVEAEDLPFRPEIIVSDVSFISLTYVLPVVEKISQPNTQLFMLIKPQFEVGKHNLGKNGIVEREDLRQQAVKKVTDCAESCGFEICNVMQSPIEGTYGNVEYIMWAKRRKAEA